MDIKSIDIAERALAVKLPKDIILLIGEYISIEAETYLKRDNDKMLALLVPRIRILGAGQVNFMLAFCVSEGTHSFAAGLLRRAQYGSMTFSGLIESCINAALCIENTAKLEFLLSKYPTDKRVRIPLPRYVSLTALHLLKRRKIRARASRPLPREYMSSMEMFSAVLSVCKSVKIDAKVAASYASADVLEYILSKKHKKIQILERNRCGCTGESTSEASVINLDNLPEERVKLLLQKGYSIRHQFTYWYAVDEARDVALLELFYKNDLDFLYTSSAIENAISNNNIKVLEWWEKKWAEEDLERIVPLTVLAPNASPDILLWCSKQQIRISKIPVFNLSNKMISQ